MTRTDKIGAAIGVAFFSAMVLAGCSPAAEADAPAVPADQLTDVRELDVPSGSDYRITVGCYRGDRVYAYRGVYGLVMTVSGGACR